MPVMLQFIITIFVAYFGGYIAARLHVPAGGLVGSMLAVIIFNLSTEAGFFYDSWKPWLQYFLGMIIASSFDKTHIRTVSSIVWPTLLVIAGAIFYNLTLAAAIYFFSDLDLATALFAAAPGGATDMSIISIDLNANPSYVALLQMFRVIMIVGAVPFIAAKGTKPDFSNEADKGQASLASRLAAAFCPKAFWPDMLKGYQITAFTKDKGQKNKPSFLRSLLWICLFLAISLAGGLLFSFAHVIAGMLVGAAVCGSLCSIFIVRIHFSPAIKRIAQILVGAYIGVRFTRDSLSHLSDLLVPILIICIGTVLFTVVFSHIFHWLTKLDQLVSYFSVAPGGLMEMSMAAEDLHADVSIVATLQTLRLLFVISVLPTMLALLCSVW